MGRIKKNIPNLINGVSQQPPAIRFPTQCNELVNGYTNVVDGLKKRQPTEHLAKIGESTLEDVYIHTINRDRDSRYVVTIANNDLQVHDFKGNKREVNFPDGKSYLASVKPSQTFSAITVADYSFIVNKGVKVRIEDPLEGVELEPVYEKRWVVTFSRLDSNSTTIDVSKSPKYEVQVGGAKVTGWVEQKANPYPAYTIIFGQQIPLTSYTVNKSFYDEPSLLDFMFKVGAAVNSEWGYEYELIGQELHVKTTEVRELKDLSRKWVLESKTQGQEWVVGMAEFEAKTIIKSELRDVLIGYESPTGDIIPPRSVVKHEALIFVRTPDYSTTYTVTIDGQVVSFTTDSDDRSTVNTEVIASKLAEGMRANEHINNTFDLLQDGSSVLVRAKEDGYNFAVKARDSLGNTAIKALKDKTQDISDLPEVGFEGFTIAIVGGGSEDEKYYVVYDNGEESKEGGAWLETKPAGLNTRLVKKTMPHQLIAEADGSFTFCTADWSSREVGDEDSNPDPSFVNQTINDVFFYRNRLGLLSGENMLFSKDGDYWNFYLTTVRTTLDSDTIDIGSTSDRVSVLRHAVTFNEQLIVFSDSVQFAPNSGAEGLLSPATITMDIITRLEAQLRAKPVGAGQTLFFGTRLGNYSGMREYFIAPEIEITSAADITGHIPTYIKGDIIELTASSSHDILVARTDDIMTNLYVYAYFWENTEKLQSSWSRWVFSGDVLTTSFIDAELYLVIRRPEGLMLESIDMSRFNTPTSNGWQTDILLDRRTKVLAGQPYPEHLQGEPEANLVAIEKNGRTFKGEDIKSKLYGANGIATSDHYIGLTYSFEFTFSEQVIKDNEAVPANIIDRVQIQRLAVSYTDSGFFEAFVSTPFDAIRIYPFTGRIMGSVNNLLNRESLESGVHTFPINTRSDLVTIKLQSDSHLPCSFQTAEWSGVTRSKAQRVF